MSSNQGNNAGDESATNNTQKKVITSDAVRSALQERTDMLKDDGTAGAA